MQEKGEGGKSKYGGRRNRKEHFYTSTWHLPHYYVSSIEPGLPAAHQLMSILSLEHAAHFHLRVDSTSGD
jgi:hypothetical protein